MSNPHKRDSVVRVPVPAQIKRLDGEALAALYADLWADAEEDSDNDGDNGSFIYIALRLRHGARAACKRLREERDAARAYHDAACRTAAQYESERDAARLELRALEWLVVKGYPHWISCDDTTRIVHGHTGPDWQTVARALGWEG